jgi:hypothetical protein
MRQIAKRSMVAGVILALGTLWVERAPAQNVVGSRSAMPVMTAPDTRVAHTPIRTQGNAPSVSAAEIVQRMLGMNQQRLVSLERYESERTYRLEYTGMGGERRAEIHVHAVYTAPDQKRLTVVSQSGSKLLYDKVLRRLVESEQEATAQSTQMQMTLGPKNYDTELVGEEILPMPEGPIRTWVLRVTPKVINKFTYRGSIWVSEDDYAMVKIQGEPAKNPSWWINRAKFESIYVRRGHVWLPAKITSSSHVRIGGEATLTIEYGTYPVLTEKAIKPIIESAQNPSATVSLER